MTDLAGVLDYAPERLADVPAHLRDGLRRYIEDGVLPGLALRSVLANAPVLECVVRLDDVALSGLRPLLQVLYSYTPARCWGSSEALAAWAKSGGLRGWLATNSGAST